MPIIPFEMPQAEVGANNEPIVLSSQQEEIARMAAHGDVPTIIANKLSVDPRVVVETLEIPQVKKYRNSLIDIISTEVDIKRLGAAHEMLPKIIAGVKEILDTPAASWKMKDVKLFEMFLKEINRKEKEVMAKAPLINFNINNQASGNLEKSLDEKVAILPAEKMMEFWTEVEAMAERYVKEYVNKNEEPVPAVHEIAGPDGRPEAVTA